MRIVSFRQGDEVRYGALGGEGAIYDLRAGDPGLPADLNEALAVLVGYSVATERLPTVDSRAITLLPAVPAPQKVICIGVNYADHAAETGYEPPPYPTVFGKFANALIAHGEPIRLPAASRMMDYEGELAVVIGKTGKHIVPAEALAHVAAYVPFNDVSARDFQGHTSQWIMGKSGDGFAPIGPALVTADEVPDPHALTLRTTVSGEILQEASTGDMIFTIPQLIAYVSQVMTLRPGDIIATGTPAGVGVARDPQRFLQPGDTVTISITGLPELTNPVTGEAP